MREEPTRPATAVLHAPQSEPTKPQAYKDLEEEHFRLFRQRFNITLDGEVTTTLTGIIEEANLAAAALLGSTREFVVGKPLPFFVGSQSRSAFYTRLISLSTQPNYFPAWVEQLQPVRGPLLDAALFVTVLFNRAGQPERLRWALHDLTAICSASQALRAERAFVECLVDVPQVFILVLDLLGRILRYNPYLERLSGYEKPHLEGKDWRQVFVPAAERAAARHLVEQVLNRGQAGPQLHTFLTAPGERRMVNWSARAFRRSGNQGPAVLLVGNDVTELLKAQQQAVETERLAAIGETVAGLAHESRNALQRGDACLQRLRWRLQDRPEELDLIDRLQAAQDDLLRLYDDVRHYAAPIHVDTQPGNLREIWQAAWDHLAPERAGRDATLTGIIEGGDCTWPVDAFRMIQVFRNLFQNSLEAGTDPVRIEVVCRGFHREGNYAFQICVGDNGSGLTAAQRQRLFEPFHTTKTRGTGLGLAIARRLVEAQGGQILASDRPPPGAEFVITFLRRQP